MSFQTKGKVISCVELPPFIDKETKKAGERRFVVELLTTSKLSNGNSKSDLIDIKIDESKFNEYQTKIGKDVEFEISLYSKAPISLRAI